MQDEREEPIEHPIDVTSHLRIPIIQILFVLPVILFERERAKLQTGFSTGEISRRDARLRSFGF